MTATSDRARASAEGWNSGSCSYDRSMERRDEWLRTRPEWSIKYISEIGQFEASTGSYETTFIALHDGDLGDLMTRLESEFGNQPTEEPEPEPRD